jgi:cell division protein FtsB
MLINKRNSGRDATIEPAYLARKPEEEGEEDIEQLKRRVTALESEVATLNGQYDAVSR